MKKLLHSQLINLIDSALVFHNTRLEKAEENERFKKYDALSDEEKTLIKLQFRDPINVPLVAHKMNQVLAYQRQNRTEWKIGAKQDPADEIKAAIVNVQYRDLEDRCDIKYLQSESFDSGLTVDVGVIKITTKKDDNYNLIPYCEHIDYNDFIWDYNAKKYNVEDGLFCADIERLFRFEVREKYGKKIADTVVPNDTFAERGGYRDSFYIQKALDPEYDLITIVHLYMRVLRTEYVTTFNDYLNLYGNMNKPIAGKFDNLQEATELYRTMQLGYMEAGYPLPSGGVKKESCWKIDRYDFTVEVEIDYEKMEYSQFPYSLFRAFHFEDQYWTLTDMVKAAQKYYNKMMMQIDHALGKDIKSGFELNVNNLDGVTAEEATKILMQGGVLPVKATGTVVPLASKGINPQWLELLMQFQMLIEDMLGGRSFQGLQESGSESGIAIRQKQQAGQLGTTLYMDNLERTMVDLGKKLLEHFKIYDTAERIIKVAGDKINPQMLMLLQQMGIYQQSQTNAGEGFVTVNSFKHLEDASFEIKIGQASMSEDDKERKILQLTQLAQTIPGINLIPEFQNELMVASELDYEVRMKIQAGLQQQQMMQQQMQLMQATQPNNQNRGNK